MCVIHGDNSETPLPDSVYFGRASLTVTLLSSTVLLTCHRRRRRHLAAEAIEFCARVVATPALHHLPTGAARRSLFQLAESYALRRIRAPNPRHRRTRSTLLRGLCKTSCCHNTPRASNPRPSCTDRRREPPWTSDESLWSGLGSAHAELGELAVGKPIGAAVLSRWTRMAA